MIISLRWLSDFVDVTDFQSKPEVLAEKLTRAGLEVESTTNRSKDFNFVVVGLILEKAKHPNADKLSLCRVSTGEGVVHQIVCGAQNHKANDRVVVALPGAVLPGGFAIKNSVIRGVESGGMLCSAKELGLAKESEGILILPTDAPIGKAYAEFAGFDDVNFELKVTPNRADCLSHFGLAREISCLTGAPLKKQNLEYPASEGSTQAEINVEVKEPEMCPRYAGVYVKGVKIAPSPEWLRKRLEAVGLSSINNIVDVTNYVMMELGQPLHAFDAAEIKGRKIVVEKATAGENFTTLDGTQLTLAGEELVIRDTQRTLALAGVIGGKNSGVTDATTNIFLESAYFQPSAVRKASRSHGINTQSGYRFTRGVDPDATMRGLSRAVQLILTVAGGEAYSQPIDIYPKPVRKENIAVNILQMSARLGYPVDSQKLVDFMQGLGCKIEDLGNSLYSVLPPNFRFDLDEEMDLVEEYARLNGYEHIPESLPLTQLQPTPHDQGYLYKQQLGEVLQAEGFYQAQNFAFTSKKEQAEFIHDPTSFDEAGLPLVSPPIALLNPLSDDLNVMRSVLSFGLWKNLVYNFHQGNESGRLYEIGPVFYQSEGEYKQQNRLALVAWGFEAQLWAAKPEAPLVFSLKAGIEALLADLNIKNYQWESIANRRFGFLHSAQQAYLVCEGKKLGFLGSLHPQLLENKKIRVAAAIAEIDLAALLKGQPRLRRMNPISKFQAVERDLALVMPADLAVGAVFEEISKKAGPFLHQVRIFDQYQGDKLPPDQKSIAFRLRFQDLNGTLQDEVINKAVAGLLSELQQKFRISMR